MDDIDGQLGRIEGINADVELDKLQKNVDRDFKQLEIKPFV